MGEELTLDENKELSQHNLAFFVGLILILLCNNWYQEKRVISEVIRRHLVKRQQTQLQEYFATSSDCKIVIDENFEIQTSNEAAESLFRQVGQFEVSLTTKLFTLCDETFSLMKFSVKDLITDLNRTDITISLEKPKDDSNSLTCQFFVLKL